MGFFNQIEGPIKRVLDDLFADRSLRSDVTYRKYTGRSYSTTEKAQVSTFDESFIFAIRLRHTDKSRLVGMSDIQIGDQLYLFRYDDCPAGMSRKDEIVDEFDKVQDVKDISNIFSLAVAVTVKGGTSAIGS